MVGSNAAWDWYSPSVYDVKPSAQEEGEDLKEVHVSNRTVSKMIKWKWSVLMLLEIDTVQAFMTSNRLRKEREKNRKRDMPTIELRPRLTGEKTY